MSVIGEIRENRENRGRGERFKNDSFILFFVIEEQPYRIYFKR